MAARVAEAWLLATIILAGLAAGSLGLLLLGRLLGREWLTPIDDELEPAALTMPLVALLAIPVGFSLPLLYFWAGAAPAAFPSEALAGWYQPGWFILRSILYFAVGTALALWTAGRREERSSSIVALAILLPTVSLAGLDWVLGREPFWWSSLFGFAFAASQLAPALALAFLSNAAQREHLARIHDRSLTSALVTLALATFGLWFLQFLAAWMGNLPAATNWYEARLADGRWLPLAISGAMVAAALLLLLQRHRGDLTIIVASALLLAQHLFHTAWLLRPAGTPALGLIDLLALLVAGGIWGLAYVFLLRRHPHQIPQSGRSGSS